MQITKPDMWIKSFYFLSAFFIMSVQLYAQDELMNILENEQDESNVNYIHDTFKGTRLINGHTIEVRDKGVLQFLITHRFGRLNAGIYDFFGLDNANIRLGLDYSITNTLSVGIGRSSFDKVYDGFLKYKILKQSTGAQKIPFTITIFGSASVKTLRSTDPDISIQFDQKLAYVSQILIARKFSEKLSLQLMPTLVHRNYVDTPGDENTIVALGLGGRFKISNRIALTGEYYYRFMGANAEEIYNSLSVGIDIETGGHVFQLMFTNSRQMLEKGFITETDGTWDEGDIHFGFNISRVFYLKTKNKKQKETW